MSKLLTSDIGVIVSVYNGEKYLPFAIESLLNQAFDKGKYFILVIDDGSTDSTPAILERYKKLNNFTSIRNAENRGLAFSLNRALSMVKCKFVIRFDHDDIACTNLLDELYKNIGNCVFCHPYMYIFRNDNREDKVLYKVSNLPSFFASGVLFRFNVVSKYGYSNIFWEEFDLYLNILEKGHRYKILPKPLLYHRIHPDNISANIDKFTKGYNDLESKWSGMTLKKYGFTLETLSECYKYYFHLR